MRNAMQRDERRMGSLERHFLTRRMVSASIMAMVVRRTNFRPNDTLIRCRSRRDSGGRYIRSDCSFLCLIEELDVPFVA